MLWRYLNRAKGQWFESARGGCCVKGDESEIVLSDAGESGFVPSRDLVGKVVIRLVLPDRSAKGNPGLYTCVSRVFHCAERIDRLKIPVAEVAEDVTMECI